MNAGCYSRPMPDPPHRPGTYQDVLAAPEHLVAELIDGELYTSARPAPRHASAASALMGLLHGPFDQARGGPGGWRILFEPELHLDNDIVVPDVAAWHRERMPRLPDEAFFRTSPDWICEVQSPSTAAMDRGRKLRVYAGHGVQHAWMLDPLAETLEVLRLDAGRWTILATHLEKEVVNAEPFQALGLELTLLWGDPTTPSE